MHNAKYDRHEDQCRAGGKDKPADHRAAKRGVLLAAFAQRTFSRWLSQEGVVCRIGLRAKLARLQAFAFQNATARVQAQHQFRILESAISAMLGDAELQQRHVTWGGARCRGQLLAPHHLTIGKFPGGADIVMAYRPAVSDEGGNRFAKYPVCRAAGVRLAFVNLRPSGVNDQDGRAIGNIERRWCVHGRSLRGSSLRVGNGQRSRS
jgi:hypothetical protein